MPTDPQRPSIEAMESRLLFHGDGTLEPQSAWRVNAGGPAITTSGGKDWLADVGFMDGTASNRVVSIAGTGDDPLYYARRFGKEFHYHLPVPNGAYTVTLHLVDPYFTTAGKRVFDVQSEGAIVVDDLDLVKQAGAKVATTRTFSANVLDASLDLKFFGVVENAIVSAVEVAPQTLPPVGPAQIAWTTRAPMPVRLAEMPSALVGGRIYTFSGYNDSTWMPTNHVYRYDPATNVWTRMGSMPTPMNHMGHDTDGRYVYLAGGYVPRGGGTKDYASRLAYRYDTQTNTWSTLPLLPGPRGAGAMVLLGRTLHFMGGIDLSAVDHGDHWTLDLDNTAAGWQSAGTIPAFKNHGAAIGHNGSIYLLGGQIGEKPRKIVNQSTVYRYTPSPAGRGTWTRLADMPTAKSHIGSNAVVYNGRMYVLGGIANPLTTIRETSVYDFAANRWTTTTLLPDARHSGVSAVIGNKVYYAGGYLNGFRNQTWVGTFT